ncbi:MAG: sulfite exporter TauE/SafE family protein [Hyphomicrobiaceae bacterium]
MTLETIALLLAAGVAGGLVNAIAGGATLITFPAMMAAGLPPIIANASNAVAVTPGHLLAAIADRSQLPPRDAALLATVGAAVIGGAAGAVLLLVTPDRLFTLLVPALVAAATAVFAFSSRIQRAVARKGRIDTARRPLVTAMAVYGGYFGAGLGVLLLAALLVTGKDDLRRANALKNVLATAVSAASLIIFAAQGIVNWPATLTMLAGAIAGGYAGGRLVAWLPQPAVRAAVVTFGCLMSVLYALRYWT